MGADRRPRWGGTLDKLVIEGGHPLEGSVTTCGSKNAVLPILCASLLTGDKVRITNAPRLSDVSTMLKVLADLDCMTERNADGSVDIRSPARPEHRAGWENVRKMRGSVTVMGPLLARTGRAEVSLPGGCVFGVRPIDLHLKGLQALGARIKVEHGYVIAEAPRGGLRGGEVYLQGPMGSTVLGTANVMMAATLAKGRTVIHGAACEPEVEDLGRCLQKMGARIQGLGSPRIEIEAASSTP